MPKCRACGADVDGSVLACPECGERVWNRPAPRRNDPMAITSLLTGVAGLIACPFVGSIAALITGAASLRRLRHQPMLTGRRLAVAGLVTGALGMVWGVVFASIMWTWFQDRPDEPGAAPVPAPLRAGADAEAQRSLRNAMAAAKTIFTDSESYEDVTVEALTLSEPGLVFLPDIPSSGAAEVSVQVVSANEIRLAARSPTGTCFALRDVTGPMVGQATTFARVGIDPCRASEVPEDAFGPRW